MGLSRARIIAWFIDWACILVWIALTAGIGVPLYLAGIIRSGNTFVLNVVAGVVVVVPVVVAAAIFESSTSGATPGKRMLRLSVRYENVTPGFGRALMRNTIKIGIPWFLGHVAVYEITAEAEIGSSTPIAVWLLTAIAYALPSVYFVSLFIGIGRTPYDRIAQTEVALAATR